MKKFTAVITCLLLLWSTGFCAVFPDVDETSDKGRAIIRLYEKGVVDGTGDGYFRPEGLLTRSQFVKIVNKIFGYTHIGDNKFSDVASDKWYYDDVCIAAEAGYINGIGGGLFAPENIVTREQACVIVNNILNMELIPYYEEPKDFISSWARDGVIKALSNRLITLEEDGRLRATEPMTRAEACEMLEKCLVEDTGTIEKLDLNSIAKEELEFRMNRVIKAMEESVIPALENEKSVQVSYMIVENMRSYLKDLTHDYKKGSQDTFDVYETIPKEDREKFKDCVQKYNKIEDLLILYEFFYVVE